MQHKYGGDRPTPFFRHFLILPGLLSQKLLFSCLSRKCLNVNGVLLLFLFTDEVKKTFEIGIKFIIDFKSAYNDLENAETKKIVKEMEDGVSTFLCLETGIVF